jgi:hypothetical protein
MDRGRATESCAARLMLTFVASAAGTVFFVSLLSWPRPALLRADASDAVTIGGLALALLFSFCRLRWLCRRHVVHLR